MSEFVVEVRYFNRHTVIVGPFATRWAAYDFVETHIFAIQKKFAYAPYLHPTDTWWEADFNPEYREQPLPTRFKVSEVMDPSDFSFDGSAGEEIRDVEGL